MTEMNFSLITIKVFLLWTRAIGKMLIEHSPFLCSYKSKPGILDYILPPALTSSSLLLKLYRARRPRQTL